MAELADAHGSGPCGSNTMRVQVSFPASQEALEIRLLFCAAGENEVGTETEGIKSQFTFRVRYGRIEPIQWSCIRGGKL